MGIAKSKNMMDYKEKLNTAYHEAGHTLTSLLTLNSYPVHKVTILPRGASLGFTSVLCSEELTINCS